MFEESVSLWASMYSWLTPTVLFVFLNLVIGTIAITSTFATTNAAKPNGQDHYRNHQIQRSPSALQRLKSINFYAFRSPEPISAFEKGPALDSTLGLNENQLPASIEQNQPFLFRSPSVLQCIKSFNLYNYISQEQIPPFSDGDAAVSAKTEEREQILETEEEDNIPTLDEVYSKLKGGHVNHVARTKSDTEPAAGEIPPKLPGKMRKSASTKSPFAHFEEKEVVESRRPATVREGRSARHSQAKAEAADEEVDAKADDFINRFKQQLKLQRMDSILRNKEVAKRGNGQ